MKSKYPIVIETFRSVGDFEMRGMENKEPSCFNSCVEVDKYRITVEKVEEAKEVIWARLEKLWVTADNHHNYQPLKQAAKSYGYSFKGEFGSKRPKPPS